MTAYQVTVDGVEYSVTVRSRSATNIVFSIAGEEYSVNIAVNRKESFSRGAVNALTPQPPASPPVAVQAASNEIRSPIPGIVSDVLVAVGQSIEQGATVVVIEAMKMENPIKATRSGTISAIHVEKGSEVGNSALLITLKE